MSCSFRVPGSVWIINTIEWEALRVETLSKCILHAWISGISQGPLGSEYNYTRQCNWWNTSREITAFLPPVSARRTVLFGNLDAASAVIRVLRVSAVKVSSDVIHWSWDPPYCGRGLPKGGPSHHWLRLGKGRFEICCHRTKHFRIPQSHLLELLLC